jgi:hypothetical protein
MRLRSCIIPALLLCVTVAAAQGGDDGFVKLFNGKDLTGLKIVPERAADTFKVDDGVLKVSGKPSAYFHTDQSFRNFILRFDWRYPDKAGNSGLLTYIQPPHKVWPRCVEVQGAYGSHGQIFAIGGAKGKYSNDTIARKKALKPHNEWNQTEVVSKDGHLIAKVNGVVVAEGQTENPTEGQLGWQSEGTPIDFRNIVIKELK